MSKLGYETGCPQNLENSNFPLLKVCVKIVSLPKIADKIVGLLQVKIIDHECILIRILIFV